MDRFFNALPKSPWLIASPGRTGCVLMSGIIRDIYVENNQTPNVWILHHYHNLNEHSLENSNCILSFRNPVKITLSHIIRKKTDKWQYRNNVDNINIEPFYLYPEEFLNIYNETCKWYDFLPKEFKSTCTVIDYKKYEYNPIVHIPLILKLPKLNNITENSNLSRTPGPHNKWISNWKEIQEIIYSLKPYRLTIH